MKSMEPEVHPPKVSFKYIPGDLTYDLDERLAFWDSPNTVNWFKSHGYTLCCRRDPESAATFPVLPFKPCSDETKYPYAWYDRETFRDEEELCAVDYGGKVVYAQDSLGQDVVIKLARADTDEFRILEMLSKQSLDTLKDNCVIPVLDMLPIEGFWFAIMPRWGSYVHLPNMQYLHEVTFFMWSVLKGLAFLHANGIAHGDIVIKNVLINHYSDMDAMLRSNVTRARMRTKNRLIYAIFDFDHSVLIPPGIKREDFRLPYWRSWRNVVTGPDTEGGEFDYDPFVFDVAMLGAEFCDLFEHMSPTFPMLAPLLDMMTTRHLDRRFTASQALQFLEEAISDVSYGKLIPIKMRGSTSDRWKDLPPEFVDKWKHYKETPVPWPTLALRNLCRRRYFCHLVPRIRRFFFRLFTVPRTLLRFLCQFRDNPWL